MRTEIHRATEEVLSPLKVMDKSLIISKIEIKKLDIWTELIVKFSYLPIELRSSSCLIATKLLDFLQRNCIFYSPKIIHSDFNETELYVLCL